MIQIKKSTSVPKILVDRGALATTENCRLYSAAPTDYDSGKLKLEIDSAIYGDSIVKKQLMLDQHNKCCFCEADFTANGYGDVEHFRPKSGFTKTRKEKLNRPGYYWLAYDWDNLFFSCQICNQRFKKNYFPLEDETKRAVNHTFDYIQESPLLLHPSIDNPEHHITFNRHVPTPVAKSKRGKLSIAGFGIDRPELNKKREEYLQNVELNMAFAKIDLDTITDEERQEYSSIMKQPWPILENLILKAKTFVRQVFLDKQPFTAMVCANYGNPNVIT